MIAIAPLLPMVVSGGTKNRVPSLDVIIPFLDSGCKGFAALLRISPRAVAIQHRATLMFGEDLTLFRLIGPLKVAWDDI